MSGFFVAPFESVITMLDASGEPCLNAGLRCLNRQIGEESRLVALTSGPRREALQGNRSRSRPHERSEAKDDAR